jgi:uncharacterized protein DUF4279
MTEPSTPLPNLRVPMRFCIKLRIYPGSLQPNQVSEILGVDATSAVSSEPMNEPLGAYDFRIGKVNGWFLESEKRVESRDPHKHLDWFLQYIELLRNKLGDLLSRPNCKAYIDVIAWSADGGLAYTLDPSDLACLASLGVPVCFSFADYPDNAKE